MLLCKECTNSELGERGWFMLLTLHYASSGKIPASLRVVVILWATPYFPSNICLIPWKENQIHDHTDQHVVHDAQQLSVWIMLSMCRTLITEGNFFACFQLKEKGKSKEPHQHKWKTNFNIRMNKTVFHRQRWVVIKTRVMIMIMVKSWVGCWGLCKTGAAILSAFA